MMITIKCTQKQYDNKLNIIGYTIQDVNTNEIRYVKPDELKSAIKNNIVTVTNLKLTSDNRLIDVAEKSKVQYIDNERHQVSNLICKAKLAGNEIHYIKPYKSIHDEEVALIKITNNLSVLYIPFGVTDIRNTNESELRHLLINLRGNLKVIGGYSLTSTSLMFKECNLQSIDLSLLDTSNVKHSAGMFSHAIIGKLDACINTSKMTDMSYMFSRSTINELDISSFDTRNAINMQYMFSGCICPHIDLKSFNTNNVEYMNDMFANCRTKDLDLSSFNTLHVVNMSHMFERANIDKINLSSFSTHEYTVTKDMFKATKPDLRVKVTDKRIQDWLYDIQIEK